MENGQNCYICMDLCGAFEPYVYLLSCIFHVKASVVLYPTFLFEKLKSCKTRHDMTVHLDYKRICLYAVLNT
jgi:hypothetical protein